MFGFKTFAEKQIEQKGRAYGCVVRDRDVLADRAERYRKALTKIAYYDDFMSKETAEAMMSIARNVLKST